MARFTYKDLHIHFTQNFEKLWTNLNDTSLEPSEERTRNNKIKIGHSDVTFWRPTNQIYSSSYFPMGDCIRPHFDEINGKFLAPIVSDANGSQGTALRKPIAFTRLWSNLKVNDKYALPVNRRVSIWRLIPPEGYVALGLAVGSRFDPPALDTFRCIRKDLVVESSIGQRLWDDRGTGFDQDFSAWEVDPPNAQPTAVYFSANTFIGSPNYSAPKAESNAYSLRLHIPVSDPEKPAPFPQLRGYAKPIDIEKNSASYTTELPWFSVMDPLLTPFEQMVSSPKYRLERIDRYILINHAYNDTSINQRHIWSTMTGSSGSTAKAFSRTTSVEISTEWTIATFIKASAKISHAFNYTETTTDGWLNSKTYTTWTDVPAKKSVALYIIDSTYTLLRKDGTQVSESFSYKDEKTIYWTQYPPEDIASANRPLTT